MRKTFKAAIVVFGLIFLSTFYLNADNSATVKEQSDREKSKKALLSKMFEDMRERRMKKKINLKLDKDEAIKIAEIILVKVYGEEVLKQRPWIIKELEESYVLKGTFHRVVIRTKDIIRTTVGGVAYIEIRKDNAQVVWYSHTR